MCIIVVKPEKVLLTEADYRYMWKQNPDGAGIMYAENGRVVVVKGLMTFDKFFKAVKEIGQLRKMAIHFPIKTHGRVSEELTHPFWIHENSLAMMHNGVIRNVVNETSEDESDTAVFARKLKSAYVNVLTAIQHQFHLDMIESYIGYSKIVFMDGTGRTYILNEQMGEWDNNVWYSNDKFKSFKPRVTTLSKTTETVRFPFEQPVSNKTTSDVERVQRELDEVFASKATTTKTRGSENSRKQKPLLGVALTHPVQSEWRRTQSH